MINSAEMAQRILSELEEWGQENLPTILNTCCRPEGNSGESEVLRATLGQLYASGLVRFTFPDAEKNNFTISDDDASAELLRSLDQHLRYDRTEGFWTGTHEPWPEVLATSAGRAKGREILNARGYQWWKKKAQCRRRD